MSTGQPPANPNIPQNISDILSAWQEKFGSNGNDGTGMLPGHMTIGTCSCCGGAVTVPQVWGGVVPPVPTCTQCGATKAANHGPVIPMTPRWNPGTSYGPITDNKITPKDILGFRDLTDS